jgi:glycerate dehydrogenase
MKKQIYILDAYTINPSSAETEPMNAFADVRVYMRTDEEAMRDAAMHAHAVLVDGTMLDGTFIDACRRLEFIGVMATGIDKIDAHKAKERGIYVCNVPDYAAFPVAQHSFALLLSLVCKLRENERKVKDGEWDKDFWDSPGILLQGKRIAVVGLGAIGRRVCAIAEAFGMEVLPCGTKDAFEAALPLADVVSLHCPLKEDNRRMIDAAGIARMKAGVILINTARGGLIDDAALSAALRSGKVAYAGLDVLSEEPPSKGNPLMSAENCLITPHVAWVCEESRQAVLNAMIGELIKFYTGRDSAYAEKIR